MSEHRIITADYHRNGVGGAGFYVAIVETYGDDHGRYLCIDFAGDPENDDYDPGRFAVLKMDELRNGNIAMNPLTDPKSGYVIEGTGGNAWRGADRWGHELREPIRAWVEASLNATIQRFMDEREPRADADR